VFRLRLLGVLMALLCLLAAPHLHAEQEPILLQYSAASGCPTAVEFERMVFERAHSARPALAQEAARLFTISINKTSLGVQGSLTIRERGVGLVRRVRGKDCRQLAAVLALAAALAIDPAADLAPARDADNQDPNETALASADAATPKPTPDAASNTDATATSLQPPLARPTGTLDVLADDNARELDSKARVTPLHGELSIGPRMELGATPYPAVGPRVGIGLLSPGGRWRVQLGGSWLFTPDKRVGEATAEFRVLAADLSLCALALQWRDHVTGGPCLHAELGDMYGRGNNIDYRTTVHRLWSTAGAHLHVRIPSDVWFFAANVGANVLFNRYAFEFNEPETDVFSQSAVTANVNVLLGRLF
jgi:hypothetical protein